VRERSGGRACQPPAWAIAQSPHAQGVLALVAFLESSVFPVPAEVILVPMCLSHPPKSLRYASLTAVASVLGGIFGWMIGHYLFVIISSARP
jgi:membrane protein YqaA with SNARE-associated domain